MKADAVIVGSGIVGMSLAISLSRQNKKVIIIEKNFSKNLNNNRFYALSEKTRTFFENINIWNNIKNVNSLHEMHLYYRNFENRNMINFRRDDIQKKNIGYIAQSKEIMKALINEIEKDNNINLYDNCLIEKIDNHDMEIELSTDDKKNIISRYLFSCEGSKSNIKKIFGIKNIIDDYASKAMVFNIEHEKSNRNSAIQIFLETGPVAFLPISAYRSSMVISIKNRFGDREMFNNNNICNYLEKITNNNFGVIKADSKIITFNLVGFDSETYKHENIIFVGDSAHSVHPLAGMGLNLGISDVSAIDNTFANKKQIFEDKSFFSDYARNQKIINKQARQQLKLIEKAYSIENDIANKVINITMKSIEKSDFLKDGIIKYANNNISFF